MATLECIASPNGRWVAVHRGDRLVLHSASDGAMVRDVPRDEGAVTLAFTPSLLIECRTSDEVTVLTAFSLPDLRAGSPPPLTLPFPAKILATAGTSLLVDSGIETYLVRAESSILGYTPLLMGGHVRWAIGLDDDRFLVHSNRAEILSAKLRRPTGQIALPLPAQSLAQGYSQQRAWFLDDAGGIAVFRLSDGTRTSARLPAPGLRAVGHPESGWLLADLGATWQAINLFTGISEPVPASVLAPCVVLPLRSAALLMQPSLDGLDVWEIGGAPVAASGLQVRVEPSDPGRRR